MATVTIATRLLKKGKSYVIHFTHPGTGRKTYHKSFRRKDLAQEEANRVRSLLDSGKLPASSQKRTKQAIPATFGEVAQMVLDEWARKQHEGRLAQSTCDGYRTFLRSVLAEWEHVKLVDLDAEAIRDYRIRVANPAPNAQKAECKKRNVLANRRLFVIKQVFAMAQQYNLIQENVASGIPYLSEKASERKVALTPEEVNRLLEVAKSGQSRHFMPLAILLAVEHGCSRQEVLSLKWGDIDFRENRITFFRQKNGMTRTHKIMPRTRDALLARLEYLNDYRDKRGIKVKGDHVVGHVDGTPKKSFRSAWESLRWAGKFDDLHFHDHRHTYCTNLLLSGSTLKETSVMIGHKDLRMTNRYSNLEGMMGTDAQDRLAERYAKAVDGE